MKIKITEEVKRILTVSEMSVVRRIRSEMVEEDLLSYCRMAARVAGGCDFNGMCEIFDESAEIAKNFRIWDGIEEGTGQLDVWIRFMAYDGLNTVLRIGVYLTDLWKVTGYNNDEIKQFMYVDRFERVNEVFGKG